MPTTFAVIDAGSNAIRLQIASVDQPGTYRIIEQDRRPVRLGHKVFETGALDPASRSDALDALKRFKSIADRHGVASIRAIATSAMREARDGPSFIEDVAELGITLEVLSEEEEARLISLGILSGLKFDPPLGLFMDIGGGSVELAVGNHSKMFALVQRAARRGPSHRAFSETRSSHRKGTRKPRALREAEAGGRRHGAFRRKSTRWLSAAAAP